MYKFLFSFNYYYLNYLYLLSNSNYWTRTRRK